MKRERNEKIRQKNHANQVELEMQSEERLQGMDMDMEAARLARIQNEVEEVATRRALTAAEKARRAHEAFARENARHYTRLQREAATEARAAATNAATLTAVNQVRIYQLDQFLSDQVDNFPYDLMK